jgi:hypothetical protein
MYHRLNLSYEEWERQVNKTISQPEAQVLVLCKSLQEAANNFWGDLEQKTKPRKEKGI